MTTQAQGGELYILSLQGRDLEKRHRYLTFWRPDHRGYAYPLSWAGKYTPAEVREKPGYLSNGETTIAVPCELVDSMSEAPAPGLIDNNAGPVVPNTKENLRRLMEAWWAP